MPENETRAGNSLETAHLDKYGLLRLVFLKLLEDQKIDLAEKTLFVKFREVFDIPEKKSAEILKTVIEEIKNNPPKPSGVSDLATGSREYKKCLYAEILFKTLIDGRITPEENELIIKISEVLDITEDLEGECIAAAHQKIMEAAGTFSVNNAHDKALTALLSFKPEKNERPHYYKTAFKLIRGLKPASAGEKYEELFLKPLKEEETCYEALFYRVKLTSDKDFALKEKHILDLYEKASGAEQKFSLFFEAGRFFHSNNKLEKAFENYSEAFKIESGDADTAVNMLSCLISMKKYEAAEKFAVENSEKFDKDPRFLNNFAIALNKLKKPSASASLLIKAIELKNDFIDARKNLIEIYISERKSDHALAEISKLEKLEHNDPDIASFKNRIRKIAKAG